MADGLSQSPLTSGSKTQLEVPRPRSSTLCSSHGETIKKELKDIQNKRKDSRDKLETSKHVEKVPSPPAKSPIMDM